MGRQQWYSIKEVAEELGVHRNTIHNWMDSGEIKFSRFGRQYRISRLMLDRWTEAHGFERQGDRKVNVQEIA
jgi:excisionase family DNA binding protein